MTPIINVGEKTDEVSFNGEVFRRVEFPDKCHLAWDIFASYNGNVVFDKRDGNGLGSHDPYEREDGCKGVSIRYVGGKYFQPRLSEVIARAWHGPPPSVDDVVLHTDDDPTNNVASNLEWGDARKNAHHRNQRKKNSPGTASRDKKQIFILHSTYERLSKRFPRKGRRHGEHLDTILNHLLDVTEEE